MEKLYEKLKKYTLEDALKFENEDRQFIALQKLYDNFGHKNKVEYLALTICNSLICYQLSGKGEDYWEEFGNYFSSPPNPLPCKEGGLVEYIIFELGKFIKQSKNNKRLVEMKIKRLEKLKPFLVKFIGKEEEYYRDMYKLRDILSKTMKQDKNAKTIVFTVKMFGYSARNIFDFIEYPREINIPIDSRLTKLFEKFKGDYNDINNFYFDLSKKLEIPELHLDAILWINYNDLINS